jgi:CBS-domain-containing membrane protein
MFLALSLRHLVVVDTQSSVVGIITRKDLIKHGDDLHKEARQQAWCQEVGSGAAIGIS